MPDSDIKNIESLNEYTDDDKLEETEDYELIK
jgi:hypothetical protein